MQHLFILNECCIAASHIAGCSHVPRPSPITHTEMQEKANARERPDQKHHVSWSPGGIGMAHNFIHIRLFDSPFLVNSGGEEQDNVLLGYMTAFTCCV